MSGPHPGVSAGKWMDGISRSSCIRGRASKQRAKKRHWHFANCCTCAEPNSYYQRQYDDASQWRNCTAIAQNRGSEPPRPTTNQPGLFLGCVVSRTHEPWYTWTCTQKMSMELRLLSEPAEHMPNFVTAVRKSPLRSADALTRWRSLARQFNNISATFNFH